MNPNQTEDTASIGEELDENFLFNDSSSLNRSVTSLASSTTSDNKRPPSRPKSFSNSIHRLFKKPPKEHHQTNCSCDECMSKNLSKTMSEVPKIKCSFVSAPATPINNHIASSWTYGYNSPLKHNSSFSSVDEEDPMAAMDVPESPPDPEFLRPCNHAGSNQDGDESVHTPSRSKSRLSLNLISSKDKSPSPRLIPKFLRSSFSRLLQKTQQTNNANINNNNSIEHQPSPETPMSHPNISQSIPISPPDANLPPMTPSTIEYLEEAKLDGLPVIPFAYPTCVLVDHRLKNKTKDEVVLNDKSNSSLNKNNVSNNGTTHFQYEIPKSPPGTLESIVGLAQQQLRAEQPCEEFLDDSDFFCGSLGSNTSSLQFNQTIPEKIPTSVSFR